MYEIYTDGSTRGNGMEGAYGGYAFVILKDGEKIYEFSRHEDRTTNQQMELMAAISALTYLDNMTGGFFDCTLYSDSAYLINCKNQSWYRIWETNGWRTSTGKDVANQTFWEKLIPFFNNSRIKFRKVRGHTGNKDWNDYVDKLAVGATNGIEVGGLE